MGRRGGKNGFKLKGPSSSYTLIYAEEVIYKLNGNHNSKTANKYAKNKEKGIQIYH